MTNRRRIMQVVECGGPGGTGFQVAALCGGLPAELFETHLVYAVRPGSNPEEYQALARGAARYHHVPEMVREISPLSDLRAWRKLYRIFRETQPAIVHTHSSKAGFLGRTAARAAGVPIILYSPRGYAHQQSDRSALSRGLYRFLESSVSWIGTIVAVSESEAALARELIGSPRVRVVRDAFLGDIPDDAVKPPRDGSVRICAAGRLCYPRHPEAFVRLAARATGPGLSFEWIGGGELSIRVQALQEELGAAEKLKITGWLPRHEAFARLSTADIFVHFSRWEGLPNAVLEAMAAGLPVVASDIPGNREVVRPDETGYIAADEDQLLAHVMQLARNPDLRARLGTAGRETIRREFAKERMFREYARLYAEER
ncbi:MAG: glycosyltransferase family 4 protein [Elusimicrobiota bacterium]